MFVLVGQPSLWPKHVVFALEWPPDQHPAIVAPAAAVMRMAILALCGKVSPTLSERAPIENDLVRFAYMGDLDGRCIS